MFIMYEVSMVYEMYKMSIIHLTIHHGHLIHLIHHGHINLLHLIHYRPLQVGWVQQCRAVKLLMRVNVNSITTAISALQLAHAVQVILTRQQIMQILSFWCPLALARGAELAFLFMAVKFFQLRCVQRVKVTGLKNV